MDLVQEINFFTPTSKLKELIILEHIQNNQNTTQKELAQIANAATSMINVYINDYEEKGYIVREYLSVKTINYKITAKGIHRKNFLLISYLDELLKLYRLAKENVESFLQGLEDKGYKNILLYGAGEVAETILSVIRDRENFKLEIVGLIDDDVDLYEKGIMGYKVMSPDDIKNYSHDCIVITSYNYEDEIIKRLTEIEYPEDKIVRFFGE